MWRVLQLLLVSVSCCAASGCSNGQSEPADRPQHVAGPPASIEVSVGKQTAIFRRIVPRNYHIDYPDFLLLETEVTNRQYREYLLATNQRKDDTNVLEELRKREPVKTEIVEQGEDGQPVVVGVSITSSSSTGDIPYQVEDQTTVWRNNHFPAGLEDHPVALVTLSDATEFCEWLSKTHPDQGLFRLPTWNEWMIAAYGDSRAFPWGDQWDPSCALTSFGLSPDETPKRTESVRARPRGRTPEGLYGMLGNVSEYLAPGDPTTEDYFNLGAHWMGGGFDDGKTFLKEKSLSATPRQDYWGYSHHAAAQEDVLGFRVLLDVNKDRSLLNRPRLFDQKNKSWQVKSDSSQ